MGIFFLDYAPGPDLACKASVQRAYLRNTVTTTLYSRSVAPGQAYNCIPEVSRQGRPIIWPLTGSIQNGLLPLGPELEAEGRPKP
jgi:hypothetical protein